MGGAAFASMADNRWREWLLLRGWWAGVIIMKFRWILQELPYRRLGISTARRVFARLPHQQHWKLPGEGCLAAYRSGPSVSGKFLWSSTI